MAVNEAEHLSRQRGRPRDASLDVRVLAATRELLTEAGFEATTVHAIAKHSGVHSSAIYRRWSSRTAIIEQAVFPGLESWTVAATGDLAGDLRRFVRAYHSAFNEPALRAALPELLRSYQAESRDGASPSWLAVSARPQFHDILLAAPAGSVDPTIDANDVFDVLLGALLARVMVPTVSARQRPLERLVELTQRMVTPHSPRLDRGGPS
jgi:AcrR family transcriptional regulator